MSPLREPDTPKSVALITFGCAKNLVDSEVMLGYFRRAGYDVVTDSNRADVLVLNPLMHTLDWAAGRGFRTGSYKNLHLRLGLGYAGKVALERHPISIPDLSQTDGEDAVPQMAEEKFTQ